MDYCTCTSTALQQALKISTFDSPLPSSLQHGYQHSNSTDSDQKPETHNIKHQQQHSINSSGLHSINDLLQSRIFITHCFRDLRKLTLKEVCGRRPTMPV
jgi:hypothetical protein